MIKFIPKYFSIVNEIVLISFSGSSSLVYINATDFCMLICILQLYYIHIVVLIIVYVCVCVESFGCSTYKIVSLKISIFEVSIRRKEFTSEIKHD